MKRVLVLLLLIGFPALSQTADQIIKGNLFDPDRGKVEDNADVKGPIEEELPRDIPILDGIVTIGDYQRVIFRYKEDKTHKFVSGSFKKGDRFGDATILDILKNEVTIAFEGKRYKLTVDSKDKMKNLPKSAERHEVASIPSAQSEPQVVERKVSSRISAPKSNQRPVVPNRGMSGRTPFGKPRPGVPARKQGTQPRPKHTPF